MAHHHEGAPLALGGDEPVEDLRRMGVEAGVRLVEEDDLRVVDERAGDGEALRHAAAEGAHRVVAAMAQLDGAQQLVNAGLRIGHAVELRKEEEVLFCREVRVEHGVVADEPDVSAGRIRVLLEVDAHETRAAAGGAGERGERAQQRRLACAVGPEYRQERALRELQGDLVERFARAEGLRELLCLDCQHMLPPSLKPAGRRQSRQSCRQLAGSR